MYRSKAISNDVDYEAALAREARMFDRSRPRPRSIPRYRDMFRRDPRGYAIDLVEHGMVSTYVNVRPQAILEAGLSSMIWDDVRGMLDANKLTSLFDKECTE